MSAQRGMWAVVVCLGAAAWAQSPRPTVMPFPLELKRTPSGFSNAEKEALTKDFVRLVRQAGGQTPDFARYDVALKELKRQDCEREDECLMQLAKRAETLYALYASVDYTLEGAVVAVGRVVRDDGKVASPTTTIKIPKGRDAYKDIAKNALVQLLAQLKVGELSPERPVEAVKPPPVEVKNPTVEVKPEIHDPPPPMPLVDDGENQRNAGRAVVIVGVGVALVGGIVAGIGGGVGGSVPHTADGIANDADGARQAGTARTLVTTGLVALGVGAVTAAIGGIVWGTASPAPVQASVAPVNGGAVVQFGGSF